MPVRPSSSPPDSDDEPGSAPDATPRSGLTRRGFLGATGRGALGVAAGAALAPSLLAGGAAPRDPNSKSKSMLVLGGTGFLGPRIVRGALAAGFELTLFNRGRTNPHLFPEIEKIRGDRNLDQLDGLRDRTWDVVIDTSAYVPAHVSLAGDILGDNIGQYLLVSTLSVFAEGTEGVLDEDSPIVELPPEVLAGVTTIRESIDHYAGMKAHCELAALEAMPGKVTVVRPGLIVGPDDQSDRFTYWPVRVARGGEILAPGDPASTQQFIDVHDLGEWIVRLADAKTLGTFNAVGFEGPVTMEELLHGAKIVIGSDCTFTWVPDEFLTEQGVGAWMEMPLWVPASMKRTYANARAIAAGLTFRPIGDTIETTLAWHREERGESHRWRAGLSADKEAAVLAAWHASPDDGESSSSGGAGSTGL